MENFYYILYTIAWAANVYSFVIGVLCIHYGQESFHDGVKCFMESRGERKFIALSLTTLAAFLLIISMPIYVMTGLKATHTELAWSVHHCACAFGICVWHHITLRDIKTGRINQPL